MNLFRKNERPAEPQIIDFEGIGRKAYADERLRLIRLLNDHGVFDEWLSNNRPETNQELAALHSKQYEGMGR